LAPYFRQLRMALALRWEHLDAGRTAPRARRERPMQTSNIVLLAIAFVVLVIHQLGSTRVGAAIVGRFRARAAPLGRRVQERRAQPEAAPCE
jgi:hypothetical protein